MPTYRLDILITGSDRASPRISGFGRALGRIGQIAAGILIAGAIRGITNQIAGLATTAFESIADIERMTVGMEGLIARELARGKAVETVSTAIRTLTEAEILSLDKLRLEYFLLNEELAETETHYSDMIGEFGEGSMEVLEASIAVRDLKNEVMGVGSEMETLASMEGKLITVTSSTIGSTVSLAEALKLAVGPAEQLLDWVVQQALLSPYGEEEVMAALRVAAGYGFVTQTFGENITESERLQKAQDEGVVTAQRLTLASLDLVAAIGEQPETLVRIMRALGQIRGHGKLLGMEIRQLVNAGVGLDIMALSMGMTVDEFQQAQVEGKILADEFIPNLVKTIEEGLGGSAARLSKTLSGLKENFGDLRRVLLREFLGPLVYEIEPALLKFYENMSSPENLAKVAIMGENLRDTVLDGVKWFQTLHGAIMRTRNLFDNPWEIVLALSPDDWETSQKRRIVDGLMDIGDAIDRIGEIDPPGENLGFEEPENVLGGALAGLGIVGGIGTIIKLGGIAISTLGWLAAAVGVVGFLAAGFGALWFGNFLGIRDITKDAWENYIKPAFMGIKEWFEDEAVPAMQTFYDEWKEKVWDLWVDTKEFIDTDLIPALIEVRDWLVPKISAAILTAAIFLNTWLLPNLEALHLKLKDDVIPQIVEFVMQMGTEAVTAIADFTRPARNVITTVLPDFVKVMRGDVIPAVRDFAVIYLTNAARAAGLFGRRVKQIAEPSIRDFASALGMVVIPPLREFVGLLRNVYEKGARGIREAWERSISPMLTGLASFLDEHVNPALETFVGLWTDVMDIGVRIVGGLWVNFVLPVLMGLWQVLFFWVNPVLSGFVGLLELGAFALGQFIEGSLKLLLKSLQGFAYTAGIAIDFLAGVLERLRDALITLSDALPWWALSESPSYIEQMFLDTTDAVYGLDEALARNALFRPGGLNPNISSQMFAGAGVGVATPVMVTVEGDENTFVVESEGVARYITHRLREQKLKKFSEYMGR